MSMSYMLYQAERVKTGKQQREEDVQTGQLAAELGRSRKSPRRRGARGQRRLQGVARQQRRAAPSVPAARPALDDRQSRV